jgi:hypothetical protein
MIDTKAYLLLILIEKLGVLQYPSGHSTKFNPTFLNSYRNSIPINFSVSAIRSFSFRSFRFGGSSRQRALDVSGAVAFDNIKAVKNTGISVKALMLSTDV